MIWPHPDRPLAARKGTLSGKLQDIPAPAGWGQKKKLELDRWSHSGLVGWSQEHPVESVKEDPDLREAASHADRVAAGDLVAVGAGRAGKLSRRAR